jgi:hypothetical protein
MAPRDSVDGSESTNSAVDWEWIGGLDPDRLEEDDLTRIVSTVTDWNPTTDLEVEKIIRMFQLSSAALKSRDTDLVNYDSQT